MINALRVSNDTVTNVLFAIMTVLGSAAVILGIAAIAGASWTAAIIALVVGLPTCIAVVYYSVSPRPADPITNRMVRENRWRPTRTD